MPDTNTVILGDCLEVMDSWEGGFVDAIATDPPYELNFLGRGWDRTGVAFRPETWLSMLRVAKPGAHLLAFGGTRTVHRMTAAIEDAGWEIRDMLVWAYASGMPKDGDAALDIDRRECRFPSGHRRPGATLQPGDHICARSPLGDPFRDWSGTLKPAWEPIVLARKPMPTNVMENLLFHRTGALNIGATRIPVDPTDEVNDAVWTSRPSGIRPETVGFITSNEDGAQSAAKPPDGGRWPSNVVLTAPIFDGGMEGVEGGGEQESTSGSLRRSAYGGWSGDWAASESETALYGDAGTYSRFFLIPKASRTDREPLFPGMEGVVAPVQNTSASSVRRCRNCGSKRLEGMVGHVCQPGCPQKDLEWVTVESIPRVNTHTTVKPLALMEHLVRLVTPLGGVVLDPFAGSGTTALAADGLGYRWLAIEKEEEHVSIIRARLFGRQRGLGL